MVHGIGSGSSVGTGASAGVVISAAASASGGLTSEAGAAVTAALLQAEMRSVKTSIDTVIEEVLVFMMFLSPVGQ